MGNVQLERAKGTTLCVGLNILLGHLGCMGMGSRVRKRGAEKKREGRVGTPVHRAPAHGK